MKLFFINGGICHYDMTALYANAEEAKQFYPPSDVIVEAPDYVFEGWEYDDAAEDNDRFVKPTPPEGWYYNDNTGIIEPIPDYEYPPSPVEQLQDAQAALAELGVEQEAIDA